MLRLLAVAVVGWLGGSVRAYTGSQPIEGPSRRAFQFFAQVAPVNEVAGRIFLDWNSNAWRVFVRRETEGNFKITSAAPIAKTQILKILLVSRSSIIVPVSK